jgi:amidohydrolase
MNPIEIRRALHKIPELGFEEVKTARFIADFLKTLPNVEVTENVAKTGVVGLLRGKNRGKTILFRAEMDALPIGHCCGHDANMAILLGAAARLSKKTEALCGNVKFVFQPAEEAIGGAEPMIAEGVLENPKVDYAFALHVFDLPPGTVGLKKAASWPRRTFLRRKSRAGAATAQGRSFA